jgi:hypothetical protein
MPIRITKTIDVAPIVHFAVLASHFGVLRSITVEQNLISFLPNGLPARADDDREIGPEWLKCVNLLIRSFMPQYLDSVIRLKKKSVKA